MDPSILPGKRLPPHGSRAGSKHRCCVANCESRTTRQGNLIGFHTFPRKNRSFIQTTNDLGVIEQVDRLMVWKITLGISHTDYNSRVCSLHFTKDDYFIRFKIGSKCRTRRRYLKQTAVPSVMVPNDFFKLYRLKQSFGTITDETFRTIPNDPQRLVQSIKQENLEDIENVVIKEEVEFVTVKTEPSDEMLVEPSDQMLVDGDTNFPIIENTFSLASSQQEPLPFANSNTIDVKPFRDTAVQVDSVDFAPKILDYISNETELKAMTGIPSFKVLEALVRNVQLESGDKYEVAPSKMKTRERVIMTCTKMKHNLSYSILAIMFKNYNENMSLAYCRYICQDIIKVFYNCFTRASTEEVVFLTLRRLNLESYRKLFNK